MGLRKTLLRRLFRVISFDVNGARVIAECDNEQKEISRILQLCSELNVPLATTQRLLEFFCKDENEAYRMARRNLSPRKNSKKVKCCPRSNQTAMLIQISKSLLERALQGPCSISTLIEVWMWASLNAVRILRLHGVVGYEGFWIGWVEKRMKGYLRKLVFSDVNHCGAMDSCSAKNNVVGAKDD